MADVTPVAVAELEEHAFRLGDSASRCVPEPFVKRFLASLGLPIPSGVIVELGELPSARAVALRGPFAVKAWGPGIVHKSELGAVKVGIPRRAIDASGVDVLSTVSQRGVKGARLYVEEMVAGGYELLFGMVSQPPFGTFAILGMGGTNAEVLADVTLRLCPLSPETVAEMVEGFRGSTLLNGYRGAAPVNRHALASAISTLAGPNGLVDLLGSSLAEFECNPLFVGHTGVVVGDARLILRDAAPKLISDHRPAFKAEHLFAPKSVAIVGASTSRRAWGNRALAFYRAFGRTDNLYVVHPTAETIDGAPAYRSLADIPGGVDFAAISLAAELCPAVLREARGNVRTAVVNSGGFAETGVLGKALEEELIEAAHEGGVRILGPNCMGVYSPRGRQTFSGVSVNEAGHVGGVFQSGGLAIDLVQMGSVSGLRFSAVASAGNAADIGLGDLLQYLVDDRSTKTIGVHIEGGVDEILVRAIQESSGRKPVVVFAPGLNSTGSRVAASHTGALTSDRRSLEAFAAATGTALTATFEQFLATLIYLDRYGDFETEDDDSVLVIGVGGGASVLAADACSDHGLRVPVLPDEIQARVGEKNFGGDYMGFLTNPLDLRIAPNGSPEWTNEVLDIVLPARRFSDVLVHIDVVQYFGPKPPPGPKFIFDLMGILGNRDGPNVRIALVARNLGRAPGSDADEIRRVAVEAHLPLFERFDDAATAIAAAKGFTHQRSIRRAADGSASGNALRPYS